MFNDIKIYGIVGIILILGIGYFVYLIYQDLIFLKKGLKNNNHEDNQEDYQEDEQELIDHEEDYDFEDIEDEEEEDEDKYEDFSGSQDNYEDLENHISSLVEIEDEPIVVDIREPKKKRASKKKILETVEEDIEV